MRDSLFYLHRIKNVSIQSQIREMLVSAILDGQLPTGQPLPSSRKLAKTLRISRNTVVLAYQGLVDDSYLTARERSGFYVNQEIREGRAPADRRPPPSCLDSPGWTHRFRVRPARQPHISKPQDWQSYAYPFISNQVDPTLFPIAAWRECSRQAMGRRGMDAWTSDTSGNDDPALTEQIRTRLLPRRGIMVTGDQILVTMGGQNALYLLASLLISPDTRVAIEDPGYPDARNIFALKTKRMRPIQVDNLGLPVDKRLDSCDYAYVTPSHQSPTTPTLPLDRRRELLERAAAHDFIIIEDDYEAETNYVSEPTPALKSLDAGERVVYVGSLSKTLFPGLRLGYLVAPAELISEARALRQLMLRHPPQQQPADHGALFVSWPSRRPHPPPAPGLLGALAGNGSRVAPPPAGLDPAPHLWRHQFLGARPRCAGRRHPGPRGPPPGHHHRARIHSFRRRGRAPELFPPGAFLDRAGEDRTGNSAARIPHRPPLPGVRLKRPCSGMGESP